jgi:hypothetical protein
MIMRLLNSDKRFLILISLFLVIMVGFVFAGLDTSSGNFNFAGEPILVEEEEFTLSNSYTEHLIENINWDFIPDDSLPDNNVEKNDFVFSNSFPLSLNVSESELISFTFIMPSGLDAIDDDFEIVEWTVGDLILNGKATYFNTSDKDDHPTEVSIKVDVLIDNHFEFLNNQIEFDVSGEDPRNTSSGKTRTVQDGDTVTITVIYENTFTENIEFNKDDIEAVLYVDGEELDRQNGKENVDDGETGEVELEFEVDNLDIDKFDVEIELIGITEHGGMHGELFEFEIDVEEATVETEVVGDSDGDGVNDNLDFCPGTSILCDVDEAGCEMDPDRDGICNGVDRTPNGEETVEEKVTENVISKQTNNQEDEVEEKVVEKKPSSGGGSTGSFFFGLIVGFIGAALFFTLTKV